MLVRRFENFIEFAKGFGHGQHCCAGDELFRVWQFPVAGSQLVIRIVGLNTALLCQDDEDEGQLALGKGQIAGPTLRRPMFGARRAAYGSLGCKPVAEWRRPNFWFQDFRPGFRLY